MATICYPRRLPAPLTKHAERLVDDGQAKPSALVKKLKFRSQFQGDFDGLVGFQGDSEPTTGPVDRVPVMDGREPA